jgi:hypothetical protein
MIRVLIATAALLIASDTLEAQRVPSIPRSPDAPLQIQSIRATPTDFLDSVSLKNTSGKSVALFQLAVAMTAPKPCGASKLHIVTHKMPVDHANLKSGNFLSTSSYRVSPTDFAAFQAAHQGNEVLSVLTILNVTFNDGTIWARPHDGRAFSDEYLRNERDWLCSHAMKQVSASPLHPIG